MAILYWLRHPRAGWSRLRYKLWELRNPDKPWLCPKTIQFCEAHLSSGMTAIEFGSGRSTQWFSARVGRLISVEHNANWHAIVSRQLNEAHIRNVDYRLVPLGHPQAEPERPDYPAIPEYVAVASALPDKSIHFAVVDGHYRTNCIRHLIPKMIPGGWLLVDDVNRWTSLQEIPVPQDWPIADDSTNGVKRCVIWQAV